MPLAARPCLKAKAAAQTAIGSTEKAGVWGLICVEQGRLAYRIRDPRRPASEVILTDGGPPGVVEPTILHEVQPLGPVRFFVEFHRAA